MLKLPKIIFCENHQDPATPNLLRQILPGLISRRYERFFDEMPEDTTLAKNLISQEESRVLWNQVLTTTGVDSSLPRPMQYLLVHAITNGALYFVEKFLHDESLDLFYRDLKSSGLAYSGIDILVKNSDLSSLRMLTPHRDKMMAYEYLATTQSVFGRCGLLHALGIQQIIIQSGLYGNLENAKNDYIFVYSFSHPPLNSEEEKIRQGKVDFPLGLIPIDLSEPQNMQKNIEFLLANIDMKTKQNQPLCITAQETIRQWLSLEKSRLSEMPLQPSLQEISQPQNTEKPLQNTPQIDPSSKNTNYTQSCFFAVKERPLNYWQNLALDEFKAQGLKGEDLRSINNFTTQFHYSTLKILITDGANPVEAVKEINGLSIWQSRSLALPELRKLGLKGEHLRKCIGFCSEAHADALKSLLLTRGQSIPEAIKELTDLNPEQARRIANGQTRMQVLEKSSAQQEQKIFFGLT